MIDFDNKNNDNNKLEEDGKDNNYKMKMICDLACTIPEICKNDIFLMRLRVINWDDILI